MEKKSFLGDILIIIAGLFWGSMGIFVRHLNALGFSSIQVACLRLVTAGILFAVILLIKDPKGFKISPKDIPLFLALGIVSILFFTCCKICLADTVICNTTRPVPGEIHAHGALYDPVYCILYLCFIKN